MSQKIGYQKLCDKLLKNCLVQQRKNYYLLTGVPVQVHNKLLLLLLVVLTHTAKLYLFAQHGVSQEDIVRGRTTQPVKDVAYDLASLAHSHLSTVRASHSQFIHKTVDCGYQCVKINQLNAMITLHISAVWLRHTRSLNVDPHLHMHCRDCRTVPATAPICFAMGLGLKQPLGLPLEYAMPC